MAGIQIRLTHWEFYPQTQPALPMLEDVLPELEAIEQQIVEQQTSFLEQTHQRNARRVSQPESALRYATMAMNSLSFPSESTVWDKEDKFLVKEVRRLPIL